MKTKRFGTVLLAGLMLVGLLALAGCGAAGGQSTAAQAPAADGAYEPEIAPEAGTAWDMAGEATSPDEDDWAGSAGGEPTLTLPQDGRQVVLTASMTVETLEYDATCAKLQQAAAEVEGYVSATSISGSTVGYRVAHFTMRIPAARYGDFMRRAGEAGNVVSRNEYSEEVTQQVTDIEARLKVLRTKEERLLALMEDARKMEDLLVLEDQLSEVLYEIERYTASQKSLENRIAYSTVDINVCEVKKITEPVQDSYGAQISHAFSGSWAAAGRFFQNVGLAIVWALPVLLVLAVVAVVVLLLVRRARKKRAANPPAPVAYPPYPPYPAPPNAPAPTPAPADNAPASDKDSDKSE